MLQTSQVFLYLFVCSHPSSFPSLLNVAQHFSIWNKKQIILSPILKSEIKQSFHLFHKSEKFTWIRFCCDCCCSVHFAHSMLTGLFVYSTAAKNQTTTSTSGSNSVEFAKFSKYHFQFFGKVNQSAASIVDYHRFVVTSKLYTILWLIWLINILIDYCDWLFRLIWLINIVIDYCDWLFRLIWLLFWDDTHLQ